MSHFKWLFTTYYHGTLASGQIRFLKLERTCKCHDIMLNTMIKGSEDVQWYPTGTFPQTKPQK